jgi:hypothetical protein
MSDLENQVDQAQASKLRLPVVEIKMIITDLSRGSRNKFEFSPQSVVGAGSYGTGLFMLEKNADFEAAAAAVAETAAAAAVVAKTAAAATASDWESAVDAQSGKKYYFNRTTGDSSWEMPSATTPAPAAVAETAPVAAAAAADAGAASVIVAGGGSAAAVAAAAAADAGAAAADAGAAAADAGAAAAAAGADAATAANTDAAAAAKSAADMASVVDEIRNVMTREGRAANPKNIHIMNRVTPQALSRIWLVEGTKLIVSNYETVKVVEEAWLTDWKKSDGQYVFQFNVELHDGSVGETVNALAVSTWNKLDLPTTESCNNKLENIYKLSESLGQQLKQTGFGSRAEAEVGAKKNIAKDESEAEAKDESEA